MCVQMGPTIDQVPCISSLMCSISAHLLRPPSQHIFIHVQVKAFAWSLPKDQRLGLGNAQSLPGLWNLRPFGESGARFTMHSTLKLLLWPCSRFCTPFKESMHGHCLTYNQGRMMPKSTVGRRATDWKLIAWPRCQEIKGLVFCNRT